MPNEEKKELIKLLAELEASFEDEEQTKEKQNIKKELNKVKARIHWLKSQESLEVAEFCYYEGYYDNCVSRSYYAVYQGLATVLKANGHFNEKSHKHNMVTENFMNNYVSTSDRKKIFNSYVGEKIGYLKDSRTFADYKSVFFGSDDTYIIFSVAKKLLGHMKKKLKDKTNLFKRSVIHRCWGYLAVILYQS